MPADREMPKYQCHKIVHGHKIIDMQEHIDGSVTIFPDEGFTPFRTGPSWGDRFKGSEEDLGYYVVYSNGYASWSPTKEFEGGYTRIEISAYDQPLGRNIYENEKWGVLVSGPETVLAAHSFDEAVEQCHRINTNIIRIKGEFDSDLHPLIWASVDRWNNIALGITHSPEKTNWDEVC